MALSKREIERIGAYQFNQLYILTDISVVLAAGSSDACFSLDVITVGPAIEVMADLKQTATLAQI